MQKQISSHSIYKEFPILKDRKGVNEFLCKNGQQGFYVCFKNQCQKYPFMCTQKTCICKKDHQKCFKSLFQDFLQKLQNKIKEQDLSQLVQQHDQMIDLFVEKLVNQTAKIKKIFKDQITNKIKFSSFTINQIEFLTKIQNNNVKQLKGADFYKIYSQIEQKQKDFSQKNLLNFQKQFQEEKIIWKKLENQLNQKFLFIQKNIKKNQAKLKEKDFQVQSNLCEGSKIAITEQQNKNLRYFFNKKIKKAQILYRASQNNFSVSDFKKKCCQIPNTLTLIQTFNHKKVGGFTPLTWKDSKSYDCTPDSTNSTFIFSLSHNTKFNQKNNLCGIGNYPGYGPMFGETTSKNHDIYICQSAKINRSGISLSYAFENKQYGSNPKQANVMFNGNPNNQQMTILRQWEVWKIIFQE